MNWRSWLLILVTLPVAGTILWLFGRNALPDSATALPEAKTVAAETPSIESPLVSFVDPWKGSAEPRVTIVEYGNYACPHCREAASQIDRLLAAHDDVRLVWKDLPSSLFPGSDIAAEAAQCAKDQGRFWEYQAALLQGNDAFNHTSLSLAAGDLGLDTDRFGACLSGRDKKYLVERSVNEAEALGIDGTPYFFINGKRYEDLYTYEEFEKTISSL